MPNLTAEILCLGNELLIGRTVNTNASDIARILTRNGIEIKRVTTIKDDLGEGQQAINEILSRKPDILCITGGLGPTHDDIQLNVLAKTLDRELVLNDEALDMLDKKYKTLNEARKKMAYLPNLSQPLINSVGAAPGVHTLAENTHIFSLPGVPREMQAIMSEAVLPVIQQEFGLDWVLQEVGVDVRGVRESDIAFLTDKVRAHFPGVNFKSHPKKDETGYYLSLHTYQFGTGNTEVNNALQEWMETIREKFTVEFQEVKKFMSGDFGNYE